MNSSAIRSKKTIGVLIAAYNEEKYITSVIRRIPSQIDEILVVDDGSSDNTRQEALNAGVNVISHSTNRGKGQAMRTGIQHLKTDIIVFLDADNQHKPEEIPRLIIPLLKDQADFTVGSRLLRGFAHMPKVRVLSNAFTAAIMRFRTGIYIRDTQSGYRAMFRKHLLQMNLRSTRYEIESEILFAAIRSKLRIKEVPISMIYGDEESHFTGWDIINFFKSLIFV